MSLVGPSSGSVLVLLLIFLHLTNRFSRVKLNGHNDYGVIGYYWISVLIETLVVFI